MTNNDFLFARARTTDPATSHQAAASVSRRAMTRGRAAVLTVFRTLGPMTDEALLGVYDTKNIEPHQSESGLRTRRSELVKMGLLRDSGRVQANRNGRMCTVWEMV